MHLPVEILQSYEGKYQLQEQPEHTVEIALQEDNRLYIFLPATMPLELHAIKEDEFFLRSLGILVTIKQNILTVNNDGQKRSLKNNRPRA